MPDNSDALSQLFPFRWRDVELPITHMRLSIAHDLVEHKYWGVDGARVEDTGLAPIRIHATIPIQNGITPGTKEGWDPQLYPGKLRGFILAFSQRTTGLLQHPEFGGIACKAEHLDIDWDAMKRGGCDAEASWVENLDDQVRHDIQPSPVAALESAASDMDGDLQDLKELVDQSLKAKGLTPRKPDDASSETFDTMMNKITAVFDQATIAQGRPAALLNRIVYRAEALKDAAERSGSPLAWPVKHNAERIKVSANGVREELVHAKREIGLYRVPADTTLASVQIAIPDSTITDLIRLNPLLVREPRVRAGTVVRYFGKKLAA